MFNGPPPCISCGAAIFSETDLALRGDLKTVDNLILGDFQRILSGSSTILGGLGSGWALV